MSDLRTKCHELIDAMPENGLDETLGTLKDGVEYWQSLRDRPLYVPPQPLGVKGKFAGFAQSPPLAFEDD